MREELPELMTRTFKETTSDCFLKLKAGIRKCFVLGPLHNPANLSGIEACESGFKGVLVEARSHVRNGEKA